MAPGTGLLRGIPVRQHIRAGIRVFVGRYVCYFALCRVIIAHTGVGWTGNILQLFARDNWDFVRDVVETYGPVAKLQLFLGVSVFLLSIAPALIQLPSSQTKWLHVYDPKALHSVFVKDQDHFDRGPVALA